VGINLPSILRAALRIRVGSTAESGVLNVHGLAALASSSFDGTERGYARARMHAYMREVTDDHCTPKYQQQIAR